MYKVHGVLHNDGFHPFICAKRLHDRFFSPKTIQLVIVSSPLSKQLKGSESDNVSE